MITLALSLVVLALTSLQVGLLSALGPLGAINLPVLFLALISLWRPTRQALWLAVLAGASLDLFSSGVFGENALILTSGLAISISLDRLWPIRDLFWRYCLRVFLLESWVLLWEGVRYRAVTLPPPAILSAVIFLLGAGAAYLIVVRAFSHRGGWRGRGVRLR